MGELKCEICGSDFTDGFYKDKRTGDIICEECLLELPDVQTSTIRHFYLYGDYIGNDEEIEEVIDAICANEEYEKVEEDEHE